MVLWEITLGTAYFLGLKRTYRLALRIQHRTVSPKYPKLRQFLHRRTRAVFDVAIKVHRNIQDRDIEVGRNFGNFILRWLDRMKPSAQIRGPPPSNGVTSRESVGKRLSAGSSSNQKPSGTLRRDSDRHLSTSSRTMPFPTVARMMRSPYPAGTTVHGRHFRASTPQIVGSNCRVNWSEGVIRKDIMQWMMHN
ncbi:hypothetical protein AAZX31_09G189400 [Glycine max]|uniref:Uncharacterized protein n=1 Tax=Glycine max TaxID=3847 RepID=C6T347_SOYBN|nr:uncharacterized protein LOC100527045 [Glycine max]KAG4992223.1 hypothetical protein JHK87_025680 [Glycine soja]ACU16085.1 unknown [Glycine max]KAG5007811.1 hypothetical protein JHK85_026353 [Glycine max]KAG5013608.1 hypothetical protein JHK86_025869 [Glycine max]KAG5134551.1 hypothetical protein JHK82_025739 [Glycine max]|eukprot:NP_001237814.1 uncharacterized protein LOC100527045 [Glycine max]